MHITAFNTGTTPVVVSEQGHTLGGLEWGTVETTDQFAKDALGDPPYDSGVLVRVEHPETESLESESNPAARAAIEETNRRSERAELLAEKDKPALAKIAKANGLLTAEDEPLRADLERMLVLSDVDLPKDAPKKSAAAPKSKES